MNGLEPGEKIEDLFRNGLRIIQAEHLPKFGLEGVLLANFPQIRDGWKICDLCTGTGIVPLLLFTRARNLKISGVEVSPQLSGMAQRSLELNNLQGRIEIIEADLLQHGLEKRNWDLVTVNPPYFRPDRGAVSPVYSRALARSAVAGSLEDILAAARDLLKSRGRLALTYRISGLGEMLGVLDKLQLGVRRLRFVHHNFDSKASFFLAECQKGSESQICVEPPLIVYETKERLTQEMQRVYFEGKALESGLLL